MRRLKPDSHNSPLPLRWLVTDARSDHALERALKRLPRGSGLIFRHHHLDPPQRRLRFARLRRIARARGHLVAWSGSVREARRRSAQAAYGANLARGVALLRLVTVHSLKELRRAARADAVLLSPAFPTRSHPGTRSLGPLRWRLLAARSPVPVIALGGMAQGPARRLNWPRWAGIDAFL